MAPRMANKDHKHCVKCGKHADVKYRKQWYCGECLNPEPTIEYLKREREMANGHWGGITSESWNKA